MVPSARSNQGGSATLILGFYHYSGSWKLTSGAIE